MLYNPNWKSTPTLRALAYMLRHPETWPENFVWDYKSCDKCALGLMEQVWDVRPMDLGVSFEDERDIFFNPCSWRSLWFPSFTSVTPRVVAGRIDRYLAKQECGA